LAPSEARDRGFIVPPNPLCWGKNFISNSSEWQSFAVA
jgi:hypothetical protein